MSTAEICQAIRQQYRNYRDAQGSRLALERRCAAIVANRMAIAGEPREESHARAASEMARAMKIAADDRRESSTSPTWNLICDSLAGIEAFLDTERHTEKQLRALVKQLPVAAWCKHRRQRGFGDLQLALIVGEAGDLANYPNPAKLWRRMGCAPYQADGLCLMGSTWKAGREGKLTAAEWTDYGYVPRRRSIVFLVSETLLKMNQGGPYRTLYDKVRSEYGAKHPDRVRCSKCAGDKVTLDGKKCPSCKGLGVVRMREHRHAMLLMGKRLLLNLWVAWNKGAGGDPSCGTDQIPASAPSDLAASAERNVKPPRKCAEAA